MNLKILVFEDNPIAAMNLQISLSNIGYSDVISCSRLSDVFKTIANYEFDLAILDIHSDEDERAGINIAKMLNRSGDIPIIYSTGQMEYLNDTVETEYRAILKKPFSEGNLSKAIDKVIEDFQKKNNFPTIQMPQKKKKIFIKDGTTNYRVHRENILYLAAEDKCVRLCTIGKEFVMSTTLTWMEKEINDDEFIKISRKYLVNFQNVLSFNHEKLEFTNGAKFSISKQAHSRLKERAGAVKRKKSRF